MAGLSALLQRDLRHSLLLTQVLDAGLEPRDVFICPRERKLTKGNSSTPRLAFSKLSLPFPCCSHFRAVAAYTHLAPPAAVVLGRVVEQPAAFLACAPLSAQQVLLHQQRQGRKRDGTQDGRLNISTWIPDPDVAAKAHLHLGVPQILGVGGRKQLK